MNGSMMWKTLARTAAPAAVLALGLAGCATKGFVREYVETQEQPQREAVSKLGQDLTATRGIAESADQHASAAMDTARMALTEAAASRRLASKIASGELKYNVVQAHEVHFGFNKYTLDTKASSELDQVASLLDQNPRYILEITGNTDNVGSDRYNQQLGSERAESVRRYLSDTHRVPLSKMATISFGAGKPVAHGEGDGTRALNRRAEIRVLEVQDPDLAGLGKGDTSWRP